MKVHYRFSSFSQSITERSFSVVNVSTIPYNNHLHCNVPNTSFTAKCRQLHFLQDASKSSLQGGNNCLHCKDANNCLTARCQSFRNNILPFFSFKTHCRDSHSWNVVLCEMFGLWTAAASVVRLCCSITWASAADAAHIKVRPPAVSEAGIQLISRTTEEALFSQVASSEMRGCGRCQSLQTTTHTHTRAHSKQHSAIRHICVYLLKWMISCILDVWYFLLYKARAGLCVCARARACKCNGLLWSFLSALQCQLIVNV